MERRKEGGVWKFAKKLTLFLSICIGLYCCIVGGYRLIYERKVPFELVISDPEVIEKVGEPVIRPEEMIIKLLISVSTHLLDL